MTMWWVKTALLLSGRWSPVSRSRVCLLQLQIGHTGGTVVRAGKFGRPGLARSRDLDRSADVGGHPEADEAVVEGRRRLLDHRLPGRRVGDRHVNRLFTHFAEAGRQTVKEAVVSLLDEGSDRYVAPVLGQVHGDFLRPVGEHVFLVPDGGHEVLGSLAHRQAVEAVDDLDGAHTGE